MVFDALGAEAFRLSKNRLTVFWSVFFIPLLFALGGVLYHLINKSQGDKLAAGAGLPTTPTVTPVNLAEAITFTANLAAQANIGGLILVFMLIAGATVYAGDYRWETWRLISARNDRASLILGKVGVMKILAFSTLLVLLVAAFVFYGTQAVVFQRPVSFHMSGAEALDALLVWLLSYVRIVQYGLIGLLIAVMTRSMMAALFVPLALGFAQSILGIPPFMALMKLHPDGWAAQLLLPGMAYDTLKTLLIPGITQVPITSAALWPAVVSLTAWVLLPLLGALAWFRQQDLSKE
ncbi:hypothetical protein [Brevundimonas lenta]|uniref:ABC-2 type transport system permease protein n=1 Tax=Brevundimonas lenta TaxID=424796 RepID=A0A7W6JCK4_9CAUL|nr:hypothetical protein [Brevundimonas lenta]MBB4082582.1 ABC-2 type transport system permease protein [Brevundimonas lenta]